MQFVVQPVVDEALKLFPPQTILLVLAVHEVGPGYYDIGYGARDPPEEPPEFKEFAEQLLAAFMLLLEQFQERIGARVIQQSRRDDGDDEPDGGGDGGDDGLS